MHVIYALGTGGLENGLVNIINRTPPGRYRHAIVCLTEAFAFAKRIQSPDVQVIELHKGEGHDTALYWRLWKTLRTLRPAVVHTRNLAAMEMQLVAFLTPGARRVHSEHGRDVYDLHGTNRKYNLLRKLVSPFVQRYIAVSRDLENWLTTTVGINPRKVSQIYNGVDQVRFSPRQGKRESPFETGLIDDRSLVVGSVGRLAQVKNQLALIDAFALLVERQPTLRRNIRLLIVGDGPQFAEAEQRIADRDIRDIALLTGDRDDVPELMGLMDVFVLPSLGEGISNTILEAMACGLPIIATHVGGNPELVEPGKNGYLVPSGDIPALAESIGDMVNDAAGRQRMGAASLEQVRDRFNWDRTVQKYLSLYDGLLGTA